MNYLSYGSTIIILVVSIFREFGLEINSGNVGVTIPVWRRPHPVSMFRGFAIMFSLSVFGRASLCFTVVRVCVKFAVPALAPLDIL